MSSAKAFLSKHLAFLAIFYYSFLGRWGNHLYSHSSNLKALGFKKDLNIRFGIFFKCLLSKYCKIFLLICHTCCGSPSIVTNWLFKNNCQQTSSWNTINSSYVQGRDTSEITHTVDFWESITSSFPKPLATFFNTNVLFRPKWGGDSSCPMTLTWKSSSIPENGWSAS